MALCANSSLMEVIVTRRRRRVKWGLLSIAAGVALGVLSLALASFDSLWTMLGVARDLRTGQSTGLAILFLSLGFLIALHFQQEEFKLELLAAQQANLNRLIASVPMIGVFSYQTGEDAMSTLTKVIATARAASNTRISSSKVNTMVGRHGLSSPWDSALRHAVANGLTYREVVSSNHAELVRDRRLTTDGSHGVYEAVILRQVPPAFLNFIVLEYLDGTKDLWFGWMASRTSGFEGTVVRTAELRLIALFERWHNELFSAGQLVT